VGSAGSDQQSVQGFERDLERNLKQLHEELRTGSYRPRPIRRQYIQKAGSSEKRALGIPAVRDRVVQRALQMVIEPIFERQFTPHSYGFRPGRGCKDALREVKRLLDSGYSWVVDADLKSYFDSIPHAGLMQELSRYIADSRVLALIEAFVKQDIMEPMRRWQPEAGTPQGAVISPLLAKLYLHPVDEAMAEGGLAMIRYADDLVVLCRSQQQAQAALERLQGLHERAVLSAQNYQEMVQAYSYLMQIRLQVQAAAISAGSAKPDNYVTPKNLTSIEQKLLKEIFSQIKNFQAKLSYDFTGQLGGVQ
jgi:RNA-directed DNA polymerase